MQEYLRFPPQNDIVFVWFVVVFASIGVLKILYPKHFTGLFSLNAYMDIRDKMLVFPLFLYLLFTVLLTLILWSKVDMGFVESFNKNAVAWLIAGSILAYFLVKNLAQAIIFGIVGEFQNYLSILHMKSWVKAWRVAGIFLLGLLLIYSPFRTEILLGILATFLFLMMLVEFGILYKTYIKSANFNTYYFILYLCTLEILPILVLIKFWRDMYF